MSKNYLNQDIDSKRIKNILKLLVHLTRVKYVSPEFYQEGIEIIFPFASKDSPPTFITPEHLMSIEIDEPVKYYHGGRFFSFIPSAMFKTYTNDEFNLNFGETNLLWELYTEAIEKKIKEVYFDFKKNNVNENKKIIRITESNLIKIIKNVLEESNNQCNQTFDELNEFIKQNEQLEITWQLLGQEKLSAKKSGDLTYQSNDISLTQSEKLFCTRDIKAKKAPMKISNAYYNKSESNKNKIKFDYYVNGVKKTFEVIKKNR